MLMCQYIFFMKITMLVNLKIYFSSDLQLKKLYPVFFPNSRMNENIRILFGG